MKKKIVKIWVWIKTEYLCEVNKNLATHQWKKKKKSKTKKKIENLMKQKKIEVAFEHSIFLGEKALNLGNLSRFLLD